MDELIALVKSHEGLRLFPYVDTTGNLTIGYGRNLKGVGISNDEANTLLLNDLNNSKSQLSHFDWFNNLDSVRQEVFIELCFNIGINSLLKFTQTIQAIENKDYETAANDMLNSLWAKQVGANRSQNMAQRLRSGSYGA